MEKRIKAEKSQDTVDAGRIINIVSQSAEKDHFFLHLERLWTDDYAEPGSALYPDEIPGMSRIPEGYREGIPDQ